MAQKPIEKIKRIIVTGGTGVIGGAICRNLCTESLLESLSKHCHKTSSLKSHLVDLSSKKDIDTFIKNFTSSYDSLNVLVNNAAIVVDSGKIELNNDEEKLEIMFAVNILSYYRLINGLVPLLGKVYTNDKEDFGRVVNVASNYSGVAPNLQALATGKHGSNTFDGNNVYQQTKCANRMLNKMSHDLFHEKYKVGFYSCHPGVTASNVLNNLGFGQGYDSPDQSAVTSIFLSTSDKVKLIDSGKYYNRSGDGAVGKADDRASNSKANKELWDLCAKFA
ncbi:hypothetical protein RFI_29476 [Reticulomyxa filosa]|uniref:Uncharacterized protein n=1 Tax=Reticulomyxa filosa TaxID=46433 RepID=X6M225_RETFI|nr:hypothetical protein RFI_29476 [Reticulomyxa filosa]|eukprot:ETO07914.1 hypothetical protein RFI_29476 [Reticulomyxa filosa]